MRPCRLRASLGLTFLDLNSRLPFVNLQQLGIPEFRLDNGLADIRVHHLSGLLNSRGRDVVLYCLERLAVSILADSGLETSLTEFASSCQAVRVQAQAQPQYENVGKLARFVHGWLLPLLQRCARATHIPSSFDSRLRLPNSRELHILHRMTRIYTQQRLKFVMLDPSPVAWVMIHDAQRVRLQLMLKSCDTLAARDAIECHIKHNLLNAQQGRSVVVQGADAVQPGRVFGPASVLCCGIRQALMLELTMFYQSVTSSPVALHWLGKRRGCVFAEQGIDHLADTREQRGHGCCHSRWRAWVGAMQHSVLSRDLLARIFEMSSDCGVLCEHWRIR